MSHTRTLLTVLARAFLAGDQEIEAVTVRGEESLGRRWRWLRPLAQRYLRTFVEGTRPRLREVVRFLEEDKGVVRARTLYRDDLSVKRWLTEPQVMRPVKAAESWDVPVIDSAGALADWLGLASNELAWFADTKRLGARAGAGVPLQHYHYRIRQKGSGGIRLIEAPKVRLKEIQRRILVDILDCIPPHFAVHGFCHGRSIKTFVAPHVGQRVILRMDLRDFFPSISGARVQAFFRTVGYPDMVADLLAGICTNATPRDIWRHLPFEVMPDEVRDARELYRQPHLPQGAPTSPALANLCAYRLDCRLTGLAKAAGAQYTRYADDLAFSGGEAFERRVERFSTHIAAILHEEGFSVHHRKTRIMRQGVRQHLAGLVANQSVNVIRDDFDRLKAILTNCVRRGPESQNREAHANFRGHLDGRVGFVEMVNPHRGEKLRKLFRDIQWP